jgi:hypothetical protein
MPDYVTPDAKVTLSPGVKRVLKLIGWSLLLVILRVMIQHTFFS